MVGLDTAQWPRGVVHGISQVPFGTRWCLIFQIEIWHLYMGLVQVVKRIPVTRLRHHTPHLNRAK
jgi:hypothetical protein